MTNKLQKITVLIPCKNEADGVVDVIQSFPYELARRRGFLVSVIVIDNNSTDETAQVAQLAGAKVIHESQPGKGNAMRTGFKHVTPDTDYVVMIDGDHTYDATELLRLVEPLEAGFADVIIGSRLAGKISNGAMTLFNRFGNWGFSFLVRIFYRANVTDVLTGYFAWRREALALLAPNLTSEGFGLEMEMVTKMARMNLELYSVPISYNARVGESMLHPIHDGFRILSVFLRNIFWRTHRSNIHLDTFLGRRQDSTA